MTREPNIWVDPKTGAVVLTHDGKLGMVACNPSTKLDVTREPLMRTPAHDPGRQPMGSPGWWRRNFESEPDWWPRVFAEPFTACPFCGRPSDNGVLHWPWCERSPRDA